MTPQVIHNGLYLLLAAASVAYASRLDRDHRGIALFVCWMATTNLLTPYPEFLGPLVGEPFSRGVTYSFVFAFAAVCDRYYFSGGRAAKWLFIGWLAAWAWREIHSDWTVAQRTAYYGLLCGAGLVLSMAAIGRGYWVRARMTLARQMVILYVFVDVVIFAEPLRGVWIEGWPAVLFGNVVMIATMIALHAAQFLERGAVR